MAKHKAQEVRLRNEARGDVRVTGGPSASPQGSPRDRHAIAADSVIVRVEASDAAPIRANTRSRTFTIKS